MATKKISELPLVERVSGSQVAGGSVLPIVIGGGLQGTTNQISVENFSKFVTQYSAHTGSAGNTFTGPQIINNNVTITGKLTVNELVATYETASIIYSEGGNIFGNELIDKQQFTGSSNFTGSVFINGQDYTLYSSSNSTVFTNFSSSNSTYNTTFSSSNSSYNTTFSSSNAAYVTALSSSNSSYNTTFSSSNSSYNTTFSSSNSSYNTIFSSSNSTTITAFVAGTNSELARVYQTTQSLHVATASLNAFTASQDSRNFTISQYTSSTDAHIVGISAFTSSQLAVNLGNSIYTASVDSHIVGISTYTSSVRDTLARVHQTTQSLHVATASLQQFTASQDARNFIISQYTSSTDAHIVGISAFTSSILAQNTGVASVTASLNQFTASQDSRNLTLSTVTGSLIGITNGLMAFTAALDNTYATDAQLYQLYQATRSLELHSGSMIGVTNGLMAYTASNTSLNTGLRGEVDGIEAYTASLKSAAIVSSSTQVQNYDLFALNSNLYTSTGSLIGITNGLMAFTAALDSTYATDAQLFQLYQATRSIELTTGSLIGITNGLMAFTAALDSTYATDAQLYQLYQATQSLELTTGSLIGITNGLMAFTAALDSTYATDAQLYQLYAETASIKAEIGGIEAYTASLKGAAIVSSSQQITNYYKFAETASANTFYGTQTFVNAETTFNFNPQTSLLASYNYLNFGGGSIMYRNASDIYIGSNAKYGSAGTVVANYTSANGMGMLTMDGASLRYQATDVSVTAGNAYGVPIRFAINGDGNVGVNTTAPVASFLTGSLTIRKSYNNDIASVPSTTAQSYYSNQSGLYLFGRNSGISIIGGNSEEATICYGNASTHRFASISVGTGTDAVGGDLYVKVGSDTERLRIAATTGNLTVSTGNLIIGTSGKGIDFSATSNGSGTTSSELLNDYEEGTFTPTYTGTNLTVVSYGNQFGWYTKVGRLVTVTICLMTEDITVVGSENLKIGGLPFTSNSTAQATNALVIGDSSRWSTNPPKYGVIQPNVTEIVLYRDSGATGAGTDPVTVKTDDLADATGNRNVMRATLTYFV